MSLFKPSPPDDYPLDTERDGFFSLSADLLCVLGFDGFFKRLNPSWARTLGFTTKELHVEPLLNFVHADDHDATTAWLQGVTRRAPLAFFENRFRCRDGSWRWLEWTATVVPGQRIIQASARDATERRLAMEELRRNEARTRAVIESSLDCVITMDAEGRIVEFNPAAEKTFGYARTEAIGRPMAELILPPSVRAGDAQGMAKYMCTDQSCILNRRIETTAMRRDGSEFPVELAISHTGLQHHAVFTACLRDITDRKRAESEIQKLAAFPRMNPHAVFEFAADGTLTYFNDAALEMARSAGENRPSRILPPDTAAIVKQCLAQRQSRLCLELPIGQRTLSWSFYPITGPGVVHCYASDITERKRSEEQIREQAALLDKAQDAILVRDLEHRIIYWNKSAERLFGWTADEALGQNAIDLLSKKDGAGYLDALKTVLEKGEWSGEFQHAARCGAEVIVESRWTIVRDSHGHPKSILVLNTDITEKKKLEAQSLRTQRLESIGTLASGIAHDLNNVLTPILMSVTLLQEGLTDERDLKLLETLRCSAQRGSDMVKQILSFARGEAGHRAVIPLKPLASEVTKIIRDTFPKNIQVRLQTAKDLWPVLADTTQLHQVLMNLCVNARDAMPDGGTLAIQIENARLDEPGTSLPAGARPARCLRITVTDSGRGIAPEIMGKIWDPFFTTKAPSKGTGLGLTTVQNIIKSHGGFVSASSAVGRGTRFEVYLPAAEATAESVRTEVMAKPPMGRGEKILVVDDERAFQEITKAIFHKHGYKVVTANDGTEAIAIFAEQKGEIDLVLTDMLMPLLDGPATIRALRRLDPEVRIIAASGLSENESVAETFQNAKFLLKPFTTEKLLSTVNQTLRPPPLLSH
jgi:hypothetical protein